MKSYWLKLTTHTDKQKEAIRSWFSPLCDDMQVESAEVLCDKETDREKKMKVVMIDPNGKHQLVTRTLGGRNTTITFKKL